MYYNLKGNKELGFDAFIAPDDFNRHIQPVDIYEVFKREYAINPHARYIYYYSDGNFPLTLTPTANEYYRYGYFDGTNEIIVDVPLNGSAVTIFGETVSTKRWVCVYRVSSAKFQLSLGGSTVRAIWLYLGSSCSQITAPSNPTLRYIHFADLNSIETIPADSFRYALVEGRVTVPETIGSSFGAIGVRAFHATPINKVNLPVVRHVPVSYAGGSNGTFYSTSIIELNMGASISISTHSQSDLNAYTNLAILSVSESNTLYSSTPGYDIIFTKDKTQIVWVAPKTVRGICLPDELPQSQVDALGTKLSTNLMANYQLYIGTQITDITNLYLSNKRFVTVDCSPTNPNYTVEGNILYNTAKTQLLKAGTNNSGNLVIPNTVQGISAGAFNGCDKYTGDLVIPNSVTSIVANSFAGLSGLTGDLVIGDGVTSIVANSFAGLTNIAGKLTIGSGITSIAPNSISQLTKVTELGFAATFDTAIWGAWSFATFTGESIYNAIQMLQDGTAGNVKYFVINQQTMDNLLAYNSNAVVDAGLRFINIATIPVNPALYLPLKTNILDLSTNAFVGAAFNNPTFNEGIVLNGTNQYLDFGNILNIGTGSFCLSIQIRTSDTKSLVGFVGKTIYGNANGRYGVIKNSSNIDFQAQLLSVLQRPYNTISDNNWHTLTLNINRLSTMDVWIDGVLMSSVNISGSQSANLVTSGRFFIGCYGNASGTAPQSGSFLNGQIRNVLAYQRALSNDELITLSTIL